MTHPLTLAFLALSCANTALLLINGLALGALGRRLHALRELNHEILKAWTLDRAAECEDAPVEQNELEGAA